jgi:hypothetical protein
VALDTQWASKAEGHPDGWPTEADRYPDTLLWMANELYPNKPPNHGLKMFIYQSFSWY